MYTTHFIALPSRVVSEGRGHTEYCRSQRTGEQKKEFLQTRSSSNLPQSSKAAQQGQPGGKVFWNSYKQHKNKRLHHGNSAPCLMTIGTDESGDSGISRSPTPNRQIQRSQPPAKLSGAQLSVRSHSEQENYDDHYNGFVNGPVCQGNRTPKKREVQYTNKRSNYSNGYNNNRNQNGFFRNRRPSMNNIIIQGYPATFTGAHFTQSVTPPDRFLAKSHLMHVSEVPSDLLNGTSWDSLSQSIWHKFYVNQQSKNMYEKKILLWKHLFLYFKQFFPKYGLYLVGSTMNGFGSNYSDVDLCLVVRYTEVDQRNEALIYLYNIQKLLEHCDFIENPEIIHAKVPLLKFRDSKDGFYIDLNCNNSVGIRNTHLLFCYGRMDWRVKPLVLVIKLWAQWHNINDAKCMTMSSYSIVLMVIHFLQCGVSPCILPCLHSMYPDKFNNEIDIINIHLHEELEPYKSENRQSLGELLLKFFQYYSTFDYLKYAISVRLGSVIPVSECRIVRNYKNDPHQWKFLNIEEPFELTNTARSVYDPHKFEHIKSIIVRTAEVLSKTKKLDSIFHLNGS